MAGAVLNTINTRLDAAIIAFTLDHGEAKVLITDREFSKVVKDALALCKAKPLVIDYDDPEFTGAGERLGKLEYEDFLREGDPDFAWLMPRRRVGRHLAQLHLRHHRRSQGRRLSPPRRLSARARQRHHLRHGQASGLSVDAADVPLQRLVLSLDAVGRRRHPCLPARGARRADLSTPSRRHKVTHLCGAPIVMSTLLNAPAHEKQAAAAHRRVRHRRGAAAGSGARGDEVGGLQRHPCLRPDRDLRAGERQRMAPRLERALRPPSRRRRRRARACAIRCSKRSTCSTRRPCSRCRATARRSAR